MRIALVGYGRMGHMVERLAKAAGHEIVARIDTYDALQEHLERENKPDIYVEFTRPDAAFKNLCLLLKAGRTIVSGTTGWYDRLPEIEPLLKAHGDAGLFYAPNFSVGVYYCRKISEQLAELVRRCPTIYRASLREIHHVHKVDAPSGTALHLAQPFLGEGCPYREWSGESEPGAGVLPIVSIRKGEEPGTHVVCVESAGERITLEHRLFGREPLAEGVLMACHYMLGKRGLHTMQSMLG